MKVIVKARHMKLTPALKAHAEAKIVEALQRLVDTPATLAEVDLDDLGHLERGHAAACHVTVFLPGGRTVVLHEVSDDMYKAIDRAHDRMLVQVHRVQSRARQRTRMRKEARIRRAQTARDSLTCTPELWEQEVSMFERSTNVA